MIGYKTLAGIAFIAFLLLALPLSYMGVISVMLVVGVLALTVMEVKVNHLDTVFSRLHPKETLSLSISKTRKITLEKYPEKEEGYLGSPEGLVKIAPDSAYWFYGKPCVITGQGIYYSIRLEYAKIAEKLQKLGIHTKEELAEFLDVPPEVLVGEAPKPSGKGANK